METLNVFIQYDRVINCVTMTTRPTLIFPEPMITANTMMLSVNIPCRDPHLTMCEGSLSMDFHLITFFNK